MNGDQRQTMDALLGAGKYDEAATFFEQSTGAISRMKEKMANDAQAKKLLDTAVRNSFAQGSVAAIRVAGQAASTAADVEQKLVAHTKAFSSFATRSAAAAMRLEAAMDGMRDDLDSLKTSMVDLARDQQATAAQVQIIQDVLFDQQPPAVRLAMLDGGAKPGLTEKQREHLRAALQVQARQQEITSTAAEFVSYARDLNTIMGAFGAESKELNAAVQYGSAATSALTYAFNGNYLGAIASVAGVFGGGSKPDPMAVYIRQIMQAFEQINQKLDKVIELQVQTLEAIDALSRDVQTLRREAHARFDRIDFELATLSALQRQGIWKDIQVCDAAWSAQNLHLTPANNGRARYDTTRQRFWDLQSVIDYTESHGDKAYSCYHALNNRFSSFKNVGGLAGNPLTIASVETQFGGLGVPNPKVTQDETGAFVYGLSALAYYKNDLYLPSLGLLQSAWSYETKNKPGWGGFGNAYALMTRPVAGVQGMLQRIRALDSISAHQPLEYCRGHTVLGRRLQNYLCTSTPPYREEPTGSKEAEARAARVTNAFLADPLIRDQIGELVRYTLFIERPIMFAKGQHAPGSYTMEELGSLRRDHYGQGLLSDTMMVVDVSIAQQAMLYGDFTAWYIYSFLWNAKEGKWRSAPPDGVSQTVFEDAQKLLKDNPNNPWLRRNVLMLILKGQEKDCPELMQQVNDCASNNFIYRLIYDRFFKANTDGAYISLSEGEHAAAEETLLGLFRWGEKPKLTIQEAAGGDRQLLLNLQGVKLPLPSPAEWDKGAFIYPPQLMSRLDDREILASRLAGYAALDRMSKEDRASVLTILANGKAPTAP
ncbi:hypothetical protein C666_05835 [Thauera linaloolentis 47Lol = DSM 12138]|uniref:Uncharacterized protein n=2 Tax=Thauera linaloolentis TaxID=76112 RepID=N6ZBG9_THAL4|nr:hypothetical protein C666_05835 [Thauera linaloolentis 47Lol = DSM 12138]